MGSTFFRFEHQNTWSLKTLSDPMEHDRFMAFVNHGTSTFGIFFGRHTWDPPQLHKQVFWHGEDSPWLTEILLRGFHAQIRPPMWDTVHDKAWWRKHRNERKVWWPECPNRGRSSDGSVVPQEWQGSASSEETNIKFNLIWDRCDPKSQSLQNDHHLPHCTFWVHFHLQWCRTPVLTVVEKSSPLVMAYYCSPRRDG